MKNLHFNWLLLTKLYNFWARKKYRGVICHDIRMWCKIWRKTTLWFGKWHEEFGKFSPEHTKVSKLRLSLGSFIQSIKFMSLNNSYGVMELCLMTMKNDAKYENELTCQLKIDPRNLQILTWALENLKNVHLMGWFWPKCIMLELRKCRGLMFDLTQDWYHIWRRTD